MPATSPGMPACRLRSLWTLVEYEICVGRASMMLATLFK